MTCLHVDGPKIHEEDDLQLDVRLTTDGNAGAHVGVLAMPQQELVPADQDLPHPLEDVRVVEDLVLDELLGHGEEDLAGYVPEGVDRCFGVPQLDLVGFVQFTQCIHGFLQRKEKMLVWQLAIGNLLTFSFSYSTTVDLIIYLYFQKLKYFRNIHLLH